MAEDIRDEFAEVDLSDERRNRRLGEVAAAMNRAPAASVSAACGGWNESMAAYRLLHCEDVTPEALLAPHQQAVVERGEQHECILVAQDTTELDYTAMKEMEGIGPLNDDYRRGMLLHASYALSEQGVPLGVWDCETVVREEESFRTSDQRNKRPIEEKESLRWLEGYRKAQELAQALPECEIISLSDREGDIFEIFEAWHEAREGPRAEWIIRANRNRALLGIEEGSPSKLFEAVAAAPVLGEIQFEMRERKGVKKIKRNTRAFHRKARTVHQQVRVMKITPRPPWRPDRKLQQVSFWAILAEETNPPEGEEPITWLLLTSMKPGTLNKARRILNCYLRRWDIEVFFRVLKTGCRVERIQLKEAGAVLNALSIYLVIAWRILYLTHLGRECPDLPCSCVFEEAEWKATCAVAKRSKVAGEPSLSEFIRIVGKLGGHLGRKSDGPPGPQSMWQGLTRVRDFACAWHAIHGE
jgi:hypothetical protein